ncbi:MAG: Maf family nucleotide pyrophosphatase [Candidatus Micrarchaeia archaeon]
MKMILASSSPRRKRLLKMVVKRFSVKSADVAETIRAGESFSSAAKRLAEKKARAVANHSKGAVIIGADTIAYSGKTIFRKTNDVKAAEKILRGISGKTHYVVTGVCVVFPDGKIVKYAVKAAVKLKKLEGKLLDGYLKSGEWKGRAGCYDVSGKGAKLVASVRGEKETVVGLPLKKLELIFD